MVMTDGFTSLLPDVLLGIEVRASWRVIQEFQMRVLREHLLDRRAKMPGGTIQEQEEMPGGKEHHDQAQEVRRDRGGLFQGGEGQFAASGQIENAIEMHVVTLRTDLDNRCLAFGSPYPCQGGLEVEAHLIHSQDS